VVEETVEDSAGDSRIPEDLAPILEGAVDHEDDGAPLLAAGERRERSSAAVDGRRRMPGSSMARGATLQRRPISSLRGPVAWASARSWTRLKAER
jgi:hypothetical protein